MRPDWKLNGYPVMQLAAHANGYTTVMVYMGADNAFTPWCVASWWPELGERWQWGHYEQTEGAADYQFDVVAKRNAARGKI